MAEPPQRGLRDYIAWHRAYDDPESALSRRLVAVQDHIRDALDARPGPFRALSACSGDGRDLLDVLAVREDADRVEAILLEAHRGIADQARRRAAEAGLAAVEVRTVDAGQTRSYLGAVPADLVLLVGIFGNIADEDIHTTIRALPQFCCSGATVVWSRGREDRDLGAQIREWFGEVGCAELAYRTWPDSSAGVGATRFLGQPEPLHLDRRLFTFLR
ncbi:MAG: SAM-dependent methyltransferase [Actinomycetota bacterium]|nr:SAM-dependent methyltransferase [Actinomycetota bacterium]